MRRHWKTCVLKLGEQLFPVAPQGQPDNSPAFQRRVKFGIARVPQGRLNIAHVLRKFLLPLHIQHEGTPTAHHTRPARPSLAVPRRHCPPKQHEGRRSWWSRRSCSYFVVIACVDVCLEGDATHQRRFFKMDSRNISRTADFFMAGGIQRIQCECVAIRPDE